tara:strand:+ start:571 stop:732 length:162 start_codon:yes stop_codon:yes gene_type:complete
MTAVYTNIQTNEVYELSGVSNIGKAWGLSKLVCSRNNWNENMFAEDVVVTMSK